MKKLLKSIAAIMLTVALVCAAGCHKPDDPNNGGNENNSEIINPNYVMIDWDNATLLSANDSIGDYRIQFNGEMPELRPGSIITIDQDTVVHHRFIETVNLSGNTVSVTSTEAYLTDIFADTDFTLTTSIEGKSTSKGNVFYPVAIYQCDENGIYKVLDMKNSREGGFGFTHNLWHFGENFDGEVLSSGNNYKLYMEELNYDFDIDLEMYMNFSGRDVYEIVGNAIDRFRSKTLNINAYLLGTFSTEQKVHCDIWGSCSWNPGYDIWKHNLFPPMDVRFIVYGVPVIIKINSDLYRQVQVTASGEISAYTGFTDNAEGRLGFEWQQSSGMSPIASFSNTFDFVPPTVEGRGAVEAKAWAFPRIRLLLYGVVGPSFDIKPYLFTKVRGGFKEEMLGLTNDFCAWSLDFNTGLDACCGLSLQFMGYEVENYSTPNWNVFEKTLYHSPKRVLHTSKNDGQKRIVSFSVYDQNYLFNTEVLTPLPQFVKFEANGQLSSEYGIAHNGRVTVNWNPIGNDTLYAKLYDINGNVMATDVVTAEMNVTTLPVTDVTRRTALGGGNIVANDYVNVTGCGICWSISHNPTINDNHGSGDLGEGSFTVNITDLTPDMTYYVRAYAKVGTEYFYGDERSFTTQGDWVDLGLPSGLLWATRNVGANESEDYGAYFAWGETSSKSMYDWDTYRYGYIDDNDHLNITKYNTDSYYGLVDNLTTLHSGDDAATANYGGRMPTKEEWLELYNHCSSTWTTVNGVNGRRFTGPNGNTLFLPAAGSRWDDGFLSLGSGGNYLSSSLNTGRPLHAWYFSFNSSNTAVGSMGYRGNGNSVRAVCSARQN